MSMPPDRRISLSPDRAPPQEAGCSFTTRSVAASTAFALPMGYQTHMMVYGPGGYKFSDFIRVGIPLDIITGIVACLTIPMFWPL